LVLTQILAAVGGASEAANSAASAANSAAASAATAAQVVADFNAVNVGQILTKLTAIQTLLTEIRDQGKKPK
jgi:hypothetical protein